MKPQACFVNSEEPPVSIRHIAWMVKEDATDSNCLLLIEIVEEEYPHPEAPEEARIHLQNQHVYKKIKRTDQKAASLIVLMAAQDTCKQIFGESPNLKGFLDRQ